MEIVIKCLYLLVGGMGGYFLARQLPSRLEQSLTQAILSGKRVVVSIGELAYLYELVDGQIVVKTGTMEASYDAPTENLGTDGPIQ